MASLAVELKTDLYPPKFNSSVVTAYVSELPDVPTIPENGIEPNGYAINPP
jgi:hypothetical protein